MNWKQRFVHTLEVFLIPTQVQFIWSVCLSIAVLLITHVNLVTSLLSSRAYVPESDLSSVVTAYLIQMNHINNVERIVNSLFWAVAAFAAYVGYIIVSNLLIETVNDYVVENKFFNRTKPTSWWGKFHSVVARLGWAMVLLFAISLTFTILLPMWLSWVGQPFYIPNASPVLVLAAVAGLALNIYVLWVLALAVFDAEW